MSEATKYVEYARLRREAEKAIVYHRSDHAAEGVLMSEEHYGKVNIFAEAGTVLSLLGEVQNLHRENAQLKDALAPFASFAQWVIALRELDGDPPLSSHHCVVSSMGAGGSNYVWWSDFLRALYVLGGKNEP